MACLGNKASTLVIWCELMTHWKSSLCWERLRAEGEESDRGWEAWMASPMQWTWTWTNSGRWWGTGRPGMLQSMGSQSRARLGDWQQQQVCNQSCRPLLTHTSLTLSCPYPPHLYPGGRQDTLLTSLSLPETGKQSFSPTIDGNHSISGGQIGHSHHIVRFIPSALQLYLQKLMEKNSSSNTEISVRGYLL